ncbi:LOW QUALITY PROTEIN: hypothetical protein MAR_021143 [Mya arenaria]|uniref:Ig-like domain-containing protein n=1 Tax=Mya arenaria TaxID=6604 RepID=A0ABY7E9B7_MYAAR|nr:LOW QUALITY PROTEIN: hypothetical protein MAR_021143 [Mya arenaria]
MQDFTYVKVVRWSVLQLLLTFAGTQGALFLISDKQYAHLQGEITLTCNTSDNVSSIEFRRDDKYVGKCVISSCETSATKFIVNKNTEPVGYNIFTVTVKGFEVNDDGFYKCIDKESSQESGIQITHTVDITSVTLTPKKDPISVIENVPELFRCVTSTCRPAASVTWILGSTQLTSGIESITSQDHQQNTRWNIQDNSKEQLDPIQSTGNEAKVTNITLSNVDDGQKFEANESSQVIFHCQAQGNPLSNVVLSKENHDLKTESNTNELAFTIIKSVCEDDGTYQCSAQNIHNTKADIRCSSCINIGPKKAERHKRYWSPCCFNSYATFPRPGVVDILWEKQLSALNTWHIVPNASHIEILISEDGLQTQLSFSSVMQDDFGYYRVHVNNELGNYNETFSLQKQGELRSKLQSMSHTDGTEDDNDDEYENTENPRGANGVDNHVNHDVPLAKETAKENVNKDGLVYEELTFSNPTKEQQRIVIHGSDEITKYAEVDLTKTAKPLREKDEKKIKLPSK